MVALDPTQKRIVKYIILVLMIFVIFYIMINKILGGMAGTPLA